MEKEKAKELQVFYSEQLIIYQKEELSAVERVKTAVVNLKNAKTELAEAKENLTGIRGGISMFTYELQRMEKELNT